MRITIDSLVAEVRRLCETTPDNRYSIGPELKRMRSGADLPACSYIDGTCSDKSCGCIIGQAFKNLGITRAQLKEIDEAGSIRQVFYANKGDGEYYRDIVFSSCDPTEDVDLKIDWLKAIQNWQDHGYTWGEALIHANGNRIMPWLPKATAMAGS